MPFPAGKIIDHRFIVLNVIGEGGMATVYRVKQPDIDRVLALKIMHLEWEEDPGNRARFLREAQVISQLKHPSIVQFLHYGITSDNHPYIAMELCTGKSLRKLINELGKIPWRRALRITELAAAAIGHAHSNGVVHRDLTPQNILVEQNGDQERIKIIDFGLSSVEKKKEEEKTLTETGSLIGSVHYMSPEQSKGQKCSPKSDVYALACILYEMLSGSPPFTADSAMGVLFKHAKSEARDLSLADAPENTSQQINRLLKICMNRDADLRLSAEQLQEACSLIREQKLEDTQDWLSSFPKAVKVKEENKKPALFVLLFSAIVFVFYSLLPMERKADFVPQKQERKNAEIEILVRLPLAKFLEDISGKTTLPASAESLQELWKSRHLSNEFENPIELSEEANNCASTFLLSKPSLARFASIVGLEACKKYSPVSLDLVCNLIKCKASALQAMKTKNEQVADQEIAKIDPSLFRTGKASDSTTISALILRLRANIAFSFADLNQANKLMLDYFSNYTKTPVSQHEADDIAILFSGIVASNEGARNFDAAKELLVKGKPWYEATTKGTTLSNNQLAALLTLIRECQIIKLQTLANSYWELVPQTVRAQKEAEPALDEAVDLAILLSCKKEFDRAVSYCLRRARILEENKRLQVAANEICRAIRFQNFAKKKIVKQSDFATLQRLWFSEKPSDEKVLLRQLTALSRETKGSYLYKSAQELINKASEPPFVNMLSPVVGAEISKIKMSEPGSAGVPPNTTNLSPLQQPR